MRTKKDRKHSGRVTPDLLIPKKIAIEECLLPQEHWSDWDDYRDGMRGYKDSKKIQSPYVWCANYIEVDKFNKKNKLLLNRRKFKNKY